MMVAWAISNLKRYRRWITRKFRGKCQMHNRDANQMGIMKKTRQVHYGLCVKFFPSWSSLISNEKQFWNFWLLLLLSNNVFKVNCLISTPKGTGPQLLNLPNIEFFFWKTVWNFTKRTSCPNFKSFRLLHHSVIM